MNQETKVMTIPVNVSERGWVNLRELHSFLEVGKDFSTWAKGRIDQLGLDPETQYRSLPQNGELTQHGLQGRIDKVVAG